MRCRVDLAWCRDNRIAHCRHVGMSWHRLISPEARKRRPLDAYTSPCLHPKALWCKNRGEPVLMAVSLCIRSLFVRRFMVLSKVHPMEILITIALEAEPLACRRALELSLRLHHDAAWSPGITAQPACLVQYRRPLKSAFFAPSP